MKSDMDPYFSDMDRINYTGVMCEGAAALVFCATDIAKKFRKKPIEVVNVAQCDYSVLTPNCIHHMNIGAAQKIYDITGCKPEDIEYLSCTNMNQFEMLDACEAVGYMPQGEAWKYFRDGKTRFDREKPVNTDGGTQGTGHACIHRSAQLQRSSPADAWGSWRPPDSDAPEDGNGSRRGCLPYDIYCNSENS